MPSSQTKQDYKVLGFDFGMKSIGVAIGQSITQSASPLDALPAVDGIPRWSDIEILIQQWQPNQLVVGIPLNMDGSEQEITHAAIKFANRLHSKFLIPVSHVDERLTTKAAKEQLFSECGAKGLNKSAVDSLSAKLIIEQWLHEQQ